MTSLRTIAVAVLFALAALVPQTHVPQALAKSDKTLHIGGTGSALGGMKLLANAFMKSHPDTKITVLPSLGSGGGIKALTAGKIEISLSSRILKDAERKKGIIASEYARTPIVFATRHDTTANGVTLEQLVSIYMGETASWPDGSRMRLILRPSIESDSKLIRSFSPAMDKAVEAALNRKEFHMAINDQDNASVLEKVPGSLGMTTLAQIMTERRRIKPLALNGLAGTSETLRSGDYPYAKRLFLVTRSKPASRVDAFVQFIYSREGQAILTSTGHVVVSASGKPDM